jgi:ABC-type Fe3+/spermidine/putrescine transport system ATPase subunit
MMFRSCALFPHLDCVDNVSFSPRMHGLPKVERRMKARHAPPCRNGNPGGAAPFGRPGTTFVAHFIGGHNPLRSTVEAADAKGARLDGPHGIAIAMARPGPETGSVVHVTIRADRLHIERAGQRLRAVGAGNGQHTP